MLSIENIRTRSKYLHQFKFSLGLRSYMDRLLRVTSIIRVFDGNSDNCVKIVHT